MALAIMIVIIVMPVVAGPLGLGAPSLPAAGTPVTLPGGYRVNVVDEGTGPAVILIHGLPGSAYDWDPLPGLLTAAGCRVIRYDRVGYGHSNRRRIDAEHRLDVNGRELAESIEALHVDRVVLAGWSYGGGVAIEAASRSRRVAGVALIGSIGPSTPRPLRLPRVVEWPRRWAVASGVPARAAIRVLGRFAFNGPPPEGWASHALSAVGATGVVHTWTEEARQMEPASLSVSPLADVAVSVVHGAADAISPVAVAQDLRQRLPAARFITVPDGSHMLPNTHAGLVRDEIVRLVRRTGDSCRQSAS